MCVIGVCVFCAFCGGGAVCTVLTPLSTGLDFFNHDGYNASCIPINNHYANQYSPFQGHFPHVLPVLGRVCLLTPRTVSGSSSVQMTLTSPISHALSCSSITNTPDSVTNQSMCPNVTMATWTMTSRPTKGPSRSHMTSKTTSRWTMSPWWLMG